MKKPNESSTYYQANDEMLGRSEKDDSAKDSITPIQDVTETSEIEPAAKHFKSENELKSDRKKKLHRHWDNFWYACFGLGLTVLIAFTFNFCYSKSNQTILSYLSIQKIHSQSSGHDKNTAQIKAASANNRTTATILFNDRCDRCHTLGKALRKADLKYIPTNVVDVNHNPQAVKLAQELDVDKHYPVTIIWHNAKIAYVYAGDDAKLVKELLLGKNPENQETNTYPDNRQYMFNNADTDTKTSLSQPESLQLPTKNHFKFTFF